MAGWRVLLVDDDADTLESLGDVLTTEGALVTRASSATQALDEAQGGEFDLLLCDIGMPDMDGLQLMAELRRRPDSRGWLKIAVSGFGRDEDVEKSKAAGFDAHMSKPLSLEALMARLQRLAPPKVS